MTRAVAICLGLVALPALAQQAAEAPATTYPPLEILQSSSETVIGQPFAYPGGTAKLTGAIVTMAPGAETGWHRHEAPLFGYVLKGELTVDYGADGTKTYGEGDSLIEAFKTRHNGMNTGQGVLRILVVFAGAAGTPNTVSE